MSGVLESLRKNIQSVQDGISAGLQRLSSGGATPSTPPEDILPCLGGGGADLLTMYQSQWATMHHMAVQNATLAQDVAKSISTLTAECESQHSQLLEVRSLLAHLPNIMAQLHSSLSTIGCVRSVLEEVEVGLFELEDTLNEATLQEKILDLKMHVTIKREQRQHSLNMLHNDLSSRQREVLMGVEEEKERRRWERSQALTEQFQQDLTSYRQTGHVQKLSSRNDDTVDLKLEDISLDADNAELESFLTDDYKQATESDLVTATENNLVTATESNLVTATESELVTTTESNMVTATESDLVTATESNLVTVAATKPCASDEEANRRVQERADVTDEPC